MIISTINTIIAAMFIVGNIEATKDCIHPYVLYGTVTYFTP